MKTSAVLAALAAITLAAPSGPPEGNAALARRQDQAQIGDPNNPDASTSDPLLADSADIIIPPETKWFMEVLVENDHLNFGTKPPGEMTRGLGDPNQAKDSDPMCQPNAPNCDKRRPWAPFKSNFVEGPIGGKLVNHDVYPEVDDSAYSGPQERDDLLNLIAATYENIQVQTKEGNKGSPQYYAPSRVTARRRSTDGGYGAFIVLKFVVVGGSAPKQMACDKIADFHGLTEKLSFLKFNPKVNVAITTLGVAKTCCEMDGFECINKFAEKGTDFISDLFNWKGAKNPDFEPLKSGEKPKNKSLKPDAPKPGPDGQPATDAPAPGPDAPKPDGPTPPGPDAPKPDGPTPPGPDAPKPDGPAPPGPDAPKPDAPAPGPNDPAPPGPEGPAPPGPDAPKPDAPAPGPDGPAPAPPGPEGPAPPGPEGPAPPGPEGPARRSPEDPTPRGPEDPAPAPAPAPPSPDGPNPRGPEDPPK